MTIRDWEPGDHAMLYLDADTEIRVTRTEHGDWVSDKGTRYDPALPARPIEAAAICGAKPPWPWGTGAPGCSKAAGHDGDHAGHDAVWADPGPDAPLTGRAYVEDLERQRDRLRAQRDKAERAITALRETAQGLRVAGGGLGADGSRITPAGGITRTGWHVPLKGPIHHGAVPNPECGICQAQTAPTTELPDFAVGHAPASTLWGHQLPADDDRVDAHVPDTCGTTCVFDGHIRACDLDADHSPAEPHRSTGRAEVIWR